MRCVLKLRHRIDVLPTLAGLAGGKMPERKIDGKDIWPLMSGEEGARSPHETYALMHGPGTVRSGKWKFYPWQEGSQKQRNAEIKGKQASKDPVQLYDTVADIRGDDERGLEASGDGGEIAGCL